jgi:hypothetical protein
MTDDSFLCEQIHVDDGRPSLRSHVASRFSGCTTCVAITC